MSVEAAAKNESTSVALTNKLAATRLVMPGDPPPGEVDARTTNMRLFGHSMEVVLLKLPLHRAKISMRERIALRLPHPIWKPLVLLLHHKVSSGAERETEDAGVAGFCIEERLVVSVPPNGVVAIPIQVDVAGIGHLILLVACYPCTSLANLCDEVGLRHGWNFHTRVLVGAVATMIDDEHGAAWSRLAFFLILCIGDVGPRQEIVQLLKPLPSPLLLNRLRAMCAIGTALLVRQGVVPIWIPLLAFQSHCR
mmetsp:Transcript_69518/g.166660  ORF Transcript_69518/g.166660 Transcript_69518/m.166660 type:complete len:252 (-) Transcript_69518:481-1236(-)